MSKMFEAICDGFFSLIDTFKECSCQSPTNSTKHSKRQTDWKIGIGKGRGKRKQRIVRIKFLSVS